MTWSNVPMIYRQNPNVTGTTPMHARLDWVASTGTQAFPPLESEPNLSDSLGVGPTFTRQCDLPQAISRA